MSDFAHLHFHVRPSDQGQIVEVAYAWDHGHDRVVRRTFDRSDQSESFAIAEDGRETFEPYNDQDFSHLSWTKIEAPTLAQRLLDFDRLGEADETFRRLNNAGYGFDPSDEMDGWTLIYRAQHNSEVSIYRDNEEAVLIGDANGPWAVRVSA